VGSDSKNGVRHQRALSPRLSLMTMNSKPISALFALTLQIVSVQLPVTAKIRPTMTSHSQRTHMFVENVLFT